MRRGYTPKNELRAIECKSYFDSYGVNRKELDPSTETSNYKLFRESETRRVVLSRLHSQFVERGLIPKDASVRLAMVAGKTRPADVASIVSLFEERGWIYQGKDWLSDQLKRLAGASYENDVAAVVAKILLRN
jgi:hypothetical protein